MVRTIRIYQTLLTTKGPLVHESDIHHPDVRSYGSGDLETGQRFESRYVGCDRSFYCLRRNASTYISILSCLPLTFLKVLVALSSATSFDADDPTWKPFAFYKSILTLLFTPQLKLEVESIKDYLTK